MGTSTERMLPDFLALHATWRASEPAIVADEGTSSWSAFDARCNKVAHALKESGVGSGDRVGLVMSNITQTVECIFGSMKAGAVLVPLNPSVTDDSLLAMLRDAAVSAVIATDDLAGRLGDPARLGAAAIIVRTGAAPPPPGWQCFEALLRRQPATAPGVQVLPDDLCNIIYSSGTTGDPKGIVHTHGARLAWTYDIALALRHHKYARTLVVTGLYSNITWASMLATFLVGGTLVLRRGFHAGEVLAAIERERVTHTAMVPILYQRLLETDALSDTDCGSMQSMMSVGSALPAAVKTGLFERFGCGIFDAYGTTEGVLTTLEPEDGLQKLNTVGRPLPGSDIRILDPEDRVLPWGEAGEVVCSGRSAMSGYWQKPEATEAAFWTDETGRRWLRSGDIGVLDQNGFLAIVDRKKDLILSGGQNVYPADIEAVLRTHPAVFDCAVIGIPSTAWGETPLALVMLRDGSDEAPGMLHEWLNGRLGKQQRVHAVELRQTLPRNANGKLLKRELREPYWNAGT